MAATDDMRRARRAAATHTATPMALKHMEDVVDKLALLSYQQEFCDRLREPPVDKASFVAPSSNPATQFAHFQALLQWLTTECGRAFEIDKFDDPNTIANKLVVELHEMGFESEYSPARLKGGSGEEVCAVLSFLCDRALQRRGFAVREPVYPLEGVVSAADEVEDVGEEEEELQSEGEAAVEEEEEVMYIDMVRAERTAAAPTLPDATATRIKNVIDPITWKTELERVGPRLKEVNLRGAGKEWRAHVEQTRKHEQTISQTMSQTERPLAAIGASLQATVEQVQGKERYLNTQYDRVCAEYRQVKALLDELGSKCQSRASRVSELADALEEVTEKLEETKNKQQQRDTSMTDTSPLVAIKQSLAKIRTEIKQMDLRIGVVGHSLMQAKMRHKSTPRSRGAKAAAAGGDDEEDEEGAGYSTEEST